MSRRTVRNYVRNYVRKSTRNSIRKFARKSALRRVGRGRKSQRRRISRPCKSVQEKLAIRSRRRLGGSSQETQNMEGYLTKEAISSPMKNWRKRWFVLNTDENTLSYYTDDIMGGANL